MLPREFRRRLRAASVRREADDDAEWGRALLVTNHLRTLTNATVGKNSLKPLTLDSLKEKAARQSGPPEGETRDAWVRLTREMDRLRGEA